MKRVFRLLFPGDKLRRVAWIPLILMATLVSLLTYSYDQLGWVVKTPPLLLCSLAAVLIAILLNKTRWKILISLLYSLFISAAFAIQSVGRILPLQNNLSFENWLQQINWQMFLFIERLSIWIQDSLSNRSVTDDGFASVLLIFYVWFGSFWLVFSFLRFKTIWVAILPLIIQITVNVHNGGLNSLLLISALFVSFCLVAAGSFKNQERQWLLDKLDFPGELGLEWAITTLLITVLAVSLAGFAPTVTTQEGWQKISDWVQEVRSARQTPVPVQPVVSGADSPGITGGGGSEVQRILPPDVTLVGTPLIQKEGTAMWVRVADSTPRNWRTAIYTSYNGRGWDEAVRDPTTQDIRVPAKVPPGRKALIQEFVLKENFGTRLFAANEPVQPLSDGISLQKMYPDGSGVLFGNLRRYQIISWVPDVNEENLRNDRGIIPPDINSVYLQLPETLPERVRTLADRLAYEQPTPYDIAVAVQNYLRESVPYDLNTPLPAAGQDVVDYFLFEAPSGFCSYYASAMVVILRTQAIPARIVTGFASGAYEEEDGYFYVPSKAVHAWVEVYFPSYGWIPFEPTPSQAVPDYSVLSDAIPPAPTGMTFQQAQRWITVLRITVVLAVGMLVWLLGRWYLKRSKNQRNLRKELLHPAIRAYRRLRFQLADVGLPLIATQTPLEFFEKSIEDLKSYPELLETLTFSTKLYEESIYSPGEPDKETLLQLNKQMRKSASERLRLWGYYNRKQLIRWLLRKKND